MEPVLTVHAELPEELAWALAQFVKRAGYTDYRRLAASDGQAWQMLEAAEHLRRALEDIGIAPR